MKVSLTWLMVTIVTLILTGKTIGDNPPLPPQPGEVQITVTVICSINSTFDSNYLNTASPQYIAYTNSIKTQYYAGSPNTAPIRITDVSFNSLSNGSVVANMGMILASSNIVNDFQINSTIISATNTISATTNVSATITSIVTNGQILITTTAATTATAPTTTTIFLTTTQPFTTPLPPQIGEIKTIAAVVCRFNDNFDSNYLNSSSPQYIAYTNNFKQKVLSYSPTTGSPRITDVIITGLSNGSVLASFNLIFGSWVKVTFSELSTAIKTAMQKSFASLADAVLTSIISQELITTVAPPIIIPPKTASIYTVGYGMMIATMMIYCIVMPLN